MSAERKTQNLPEWKREEVANLVTLIEGYDSVGIVDITGIPSRQLQQMRRELYPDTELRVSRNTLVVRALEEVNEGFEQLVSDVTGQVGLIGTDENPFSLFQELEASKTPAPINAGETAPNDIVIPEGDTGVDPGPFVGELQTVGASARIMEGSIQVTEDSTVLEAGGEVSEDLANVLSELGIEPKEVGLDLRSVVSEGVLFEPEDLDIDVESYRTDLSTAAARGRNLAVNAAYPTDATATTLLAKATGEAKSLGLQAAIEDPDLADDLIRKADGQVRALAAQIDDDEALPEELRGVEAPTPSAPAAGAEETEDEDDESDDEPTDDAETDDVDDSDEDEDGGEALGDLFG